MDRFIDGGPMPGGARQSGFLLPRDVPIWLAARPWLDVRSNDEHTLIAYRLGQALRGIHPAADPALAVDRSGQGDGRRTARRRRGGGVGEGFDDDRRDLACLITVLRASAS